MPQYALLRPVSVSMTRTRIFVYYDNVPRIHQYCDAFHILYSSKVTTVNTARHKISRVCVYIVRLPPNQFCANV